MTEPLGSDFLAECRELDTFVQTLDPARFAEHTHFYGWTIRDEIMHLYFLDGLTRLSIEDEAAFLAQVAEVRQWQAAGRELSDLMRQRFAALDNATLIERWRALYEGLSAIFAARDPKARMKWFGPDMSIRSAASARQMEVWAHGHDLYDHVGVARPADDRIRNICDLGARTFGWSFANRKLPVPPAPPRLRLLAPSGAHWLWNEDGEGEIAGAATDFALVVTQRRHIDDTGLSCSGPVAREWMLIAQCFAGAPSEGPSAGLMERLRKGTGA